MSDDEKAIRAALEAGPTDGNWSVVGHFNEWSIASDVSVGGKPCISGRQFVAACFRVSKKDTPSYAALFEATARYITACRPAAIRSLLAELDTQRAARTPSGSGAAPALPDAQFWLIGFRQDGEHHLTLHGHNCVGDFRSIDPDATATQLFHADQLSAAVEAAVLRERERLEAERDAWAEKFQKENRELAALKWPHLTGTVRALDAGQAPQGGA